MSLRPATSKLPEAPVGQTSGRVVKPDGAYDEVKNLVRTEEGWLRSVAEVVPFVRVADGSIPTNSGSPSVTGPVYARTKGVFHAMVGDHEIILLHTGPAIWSYEGWKRAWRCLIGPTAAIPDIPGNLPSDDAAAFPTQFVATPTGVIITPQNARSYFFDGVKIRPLGYDVAPSPPIGLGPESSSTEFFPEPNSPFFGVNDGGYVLDGLTGHPPSAMSSFFKFGRLGTVSTPGNATSLADTPEAKAQIMGYLEPAGYRARVQWIDDFGNISPASGESNEIRFRRQPAQKIASYGTPCTLEWIQADAVLKQVAWDSIATGRVGTAGRILSRTKDLRNSGTADYFEVPLDSALNMSALSTLPDNVSTIYPDNIPDSWLQTTMTEVDPMPQFRLAEMAFGRVFVANWPGSEGAVQSTYVGRWGTLQSGTKFFPDPAGGEVTGLHRTSAGLLVFTEQGVYLMSTPDGPPKQIQGGSGTVSPSSIRTMRNGLTVWLGQDGFWGFDGQQATFLWQSHTLHAKRHNRGRLRRATAVFDPVSGEYRCWVAYGGSRSNNRCWTYDGNEWHHRFDVHATGACVTQNAQRNVIVCGTNPQFSDRNGVWVCDAAGDPLSSTVKTGWIRSMRSLERASTRRVYLFLRETGVAPTAGLINVRVRRDYRDEVVSTGTVQTYPKVSTKVTDGSPLSVWGTAEYGTQATWRKRRPFWVKVDIDVPACEAFQVEVEASRAIEILSVQTEEQDRTNSGAGAYK